jgi:membrane protease YdiL (CAAX protease family)
MNQQVALLERQSLRLLLFFIGICFFIWCGVLLVFPAPEIVRSALKVIVWLVPLYLLVRGQHKPVIWNIDLRQDWKPILAASVVFLFRGQLLAGRGIHGFSASFFLNAILIAPPVEEMIFRGIIFQQFAQKLSFWQANFGSSVIFTIYHIPLWLVRNHGLDPATILWVFTASLVFGWVFWKTNSLGAGTTVHSLHNLLLKMLL